MLGFARFLGAPDPNTLTARSVVMTMCVERGKYGTGAGGTLYFPVNFFCNQWQIREKTPLTRKVTRDKLRFCSASIYGNFKLLQLS